MTHPIPCVSLLYRSGARSATSTDSSELFFALSWHFKFVIDDARSLGKFVNNVLKQRRVHTAAWLTA